jgi:TatD DNase family protein
MFVDSHAHLDDPRFNDDRDAVLQRAWDAGVRRILTIGNGRGPDDMNCGIRVSEPHDWIVTSVGVHPHDAAKVEERHYATLEKLAAHPKVLAIGETGLDYYYDNSPREVQREVFRRQLRIARGLQLPVIVHTRNADADTQQMLSEEAPEQAVIHCFTSGEALSEFAIRMGYYVSFSGIVTFPKSDSVSRVARKLPANHLLVETDCPYLAPVPHRGKRNEPMFVTDTARFVASIRGVSMEEFCSETAENFERLFSGK